MFLDAHNKYLKFLNEDDKLSIKNHWALTHRVQTLEFQPQVSVYYNAWENDNVDDPIFSLIYAILKNVDSYFTFTTETDCLKKAASILEVFTGRNINGLIESFYSDSPLDTIRKFKNVENEINQFLDSLLIEKGNRLTIFIDELDRCKPSYAVKLLERIKHYFSNDRITFVFSINAMELQHTIKRYYGNDFNACRYLDRFFDLRISLPPVDRVKFYQSINFNGDYYVYDIVCDAVINRYQFSLREIAKYIQLTKIAAYDPTHDGKSYNFSFPDGKGIQFSLIYIVPIVIGLKIYDSKSYEDFINGKNFTPLIEVSDCIKGHLVEELLSSNESYNADDKNMNIVTIGEKLIIVYEALFITVYSGENYQTVVGNYTFDYRTKNTLFRTISLLSNYANMEIE